MNPSTLLSFLLTISLIITCSSHHHHVASQPAPGGTSKLYVIVCNEAGGSDIERCLKLLEGYPEITSAEDFLQLCRLILQMAIKKAMEGQNYLKREMKKNPSSTALKQCATSNYDGLVVSFRVSLSELAVDPIGANYDAKVAGDEPNYCDAALAKENILNPPISSLNNDMQFLSYIAFLATNHLPQPHSSDTLSSFMLCS